MRIFPLLLILASAWRASPDGTPRTWVRVTLGPQHTEPLYIHCFADHWRAPWCLHFSLSQDGYEENVQPARGTQCFVGGGQSTPWCDITPALHEDKGAILHFRGARSYWDHIPEFHATFEFATAPDDRSILKRFTRSGPGEGLTILVPGIPDPAHPEEFKADYELAAETKAFLQTLPKPQIGRRPRQFPFFLGMGLTPGFFTPAIVQQELETAEYLGFNGLALYSPEGASRGFTFALAHAGAWYMEEGCYQRPQVAQIEESVKRAIREWGDRPVPVGVMMMDEPTALDLSHAATHSFCQQRFRDWLKGQGLIPAELGVADWEAVRPVTFEQRAQFPALYYFSQFFRTVSLADFLRIETDLIRQHWPGSPPATVNFSDSATYVANFYFQGVDYYHLFGSQALSMAWSEDWSNGASTYQCGGYNVELLRSAVRRHGQPIGMYVITSYGRTPLDVRLKAVSNAAREAKSLYSYFYGPQYTNHEHGWYTHHAMFQPMAELTRLFGGAEDLLRPGHLPSEVAFLYSRSSDIWTVEVNYAYGMDRLHTYLALLHAQVPVDFVSEEEAAAGRLQGYKAVYLFGPNLSRAAARAVREWVRGGGVLYASAGAGGRDEYNRPLDELEPVFSRPQADPQELQPFLSSGRYLTTLQPQDTMSVGPASLDVLSVKQVLTPPAGAEVLARFADGSPAAVRARYGRGQVFWVGALPGLSYIRKALQARPENRQPPLGESDNPWDYPAAEREFLLRPVRAAKVRPPVRLDVPLVETFYLQSQAGAVVTLANYALRPFPRIRVSVTVPRPVRAVESVRYGSRQFASQGPTVQFALPLSDVDFVKLYWKR